MKELKKDKYKIEFIPQDYKNINFKRLFKLLKVNNLFDTSYFIIDESDNLKFLKLKSKKDNTKDND